MLTVEASTTEAGKLFHAQTTLWLKNPVAVEADFS